MWLLTNFRTVSTGGFSVPTWFEVAVLSHSIQMWFWKLMRAECSCLWERGSRIPDWKKRRKKQTTTVFLNGEGHSWPTEPLSCLTRDFEVGLNIALHLLWYLWYIWLFALCPCQLIIFPFPVSDKITSYRAWNTPFPPRDLMLHEKHCDVSRYRVVSAIFPQHCVLYLAVQKVAWGNLSCLILWALWIFS